MRQALYGKCRLEDIEIPNPNHYADIATLGGGILSSLSSHVLGNSDFFTGAFPAEYGNAVSGVFDMRLRNGNNRKRENTIQVGILGIDVASEGPLSKKHRSSYIVNYRYSATGLLAHLNMVDLGGAFDYQDLNFKLNFPTRKAVTFSVWGTSLIDKYGSDREADADKWEYLNDGSESRTDQYMAAGGVSHRYLIGENGFLKTTVAATYFRSTASIDMFDADMTSTPYLDMHRENTNVVFTTAYNHKFSAGFTNKTGFTYTQMFYDMKMNLAPFVGNPLNVISMGNGGTSLFSAYTANAVDIGRRITLSIGLHAQVLALNKHCTWEPRIGMKWQATRKASFALAYGLHSRMEKMDVYYTQTPGTGEEPVNKNLDFTKAHHLMLTFDYKLSEDMTLKLEPYLQALYDVPVRANDSYSVLNREDFYVEDALVNKGKGRNIGIGILLLVVLQTLEERAVLCRIGLLDDFYTFPRIFLTIFSSLALLFLCLSGGAMTILLRQWMMDNQKVSRLEKLHVQSLRLQQGQGAAEYGDKVPEQLPYAGADVLAFVGVPHTVGQGLCPRAGFSAAVYFFRAGGSCPDVRTG